MFQGASNDVYTIAAGRSFSEIPNDGRATSGYNCCDWDKTTNQIQLKTNIYPVQPITNGQEFSGLGLCYL
jgi:hypothetical protein